MAHYSVHVGTVKRSSGQNAIESASYISRSKLTLHQVDKEYNIPVSFTYDYSKKGGLAFSKIYLPENAPEWASDREQLWNKSELAENRCDARPAGKIMIALPNELSDEQNIELLEKIISPLVKFGMVVDANIHNDSEGNPHMHLQFTTREFAQNKYGEFEFSRLKNRDWDGPQFVRYVREMTAEKINESYLENGFSERVTHKSYKELGIDLTPTVHEGPARNMHNAELTELNLQIAAENAEKIKEDPTIILRVVGVNHPVFTKEQIAKELEKRLYSGIDFSKIDDVESLNNELQSEFVKAYEHIMNSPSLTMVTESDLKGRSLYTETRRLELEERFIDNVKALHSSNKHSLGLVDADLDRLSWKESISAKLADVKSGIIDTINDKTGLKLAKPKSEITLSEEQRKAVLGVLNGPDIAVLEGLPGAGKTKTMSEVARQCKKAGYRVIGVTQSSSASLQLQKDTGIECKNAALWRKEWMRDSGKKFKISLPAEYYKDKAYQKNMSVGFDAKTVMIIDEYSQSEMVTMDYLISKVRACGGKVITIGDRNQISPVGWGGAAQVIVDVCDRELLSEVRRQSKPEHRMATKLLGEFKISEALDIYRRGGNIRIVDTESEALSGTVAEYIREYTELAKSFGDDLATSKVIAIGVMTNATRMRLNAKVRNQLKEIGVLKGDEYRYCVGADKVTREKHFIELMRGEQIVFNRNANHLGKAGIFNSEVGTVLKVRKPNKDGFAVIDIMVLKSNGTKEKISLDLKELSKEKYFYNGIIIDHGSALTGDKAQGVDIRKTIPYFEKGMGFERTNVWLTRHKDDTTIFVSKEMLSETIYETLDSDKEKAKNRYDLIGDDVAYNALIRMVSKRANITTATDYFDIGKSESDKLLKEYIELNSDTIHTFRKIANWQERQGRKGAVKPNLWDNPKWNEFQELRFKRSAFAKIITSNYSDFRNRIIQSGMNYATIEKHASQLRKEDKLPQVIITNKLTRLHEDSIYKNLVNAVENGNLKAVKHDLQVIKDHIADTSAEIANLEKEKSILREEGQNLKDEISIQKQFNTVFMPEYLDRIYRCAGKEALAKYDSLVQEYGADKAVSMVASKPRLLGELRGVGFGKFMRFGEEGRDVVALVGNLSRQLGGYNRSLEMMSEAEFKLDDGKFDEKIAGIDSNIEANRGLLASNLDEEFFKEVEDRINSAKNGRADFKSLVESELFDSIKESIALAPFEEEAPKTNPKLNVAPVGSFGVQVAKDLKMSEAELIANPARFVDHLTIEGTTFNKSDIEKAITRVVGDDVESSRLADIILLDKSVKIVNYAGLNGRMLFAKSEQIELEKSFIESIKSINSRSNHSLNVTDKDIGEYSAGAEFSDIQKKAIKEVLNGSDISVLEGWPGSGKSTVTKEIASHYTKAGYEVIAAAPTNKAAQELESKLGVKVTTTAQLLINLDKAAREAASLANVSQKYQQDVKEILKPVGQSQKSLLILDEASLINGVELEAISKKAESAGWKVLTLGDNNQNHAIESKGFFAKIGDIAGRSELLEVNRHKNPDITLQSMHIEATTALCEFDVAKAINLYDQSGKIFITSSEEEKQIRIAHRYVEKVSAIAKDYSISNIDAMEKVIINAYTNEEIKSLNSLVRTSFKRAGILEEGKLYNSGKGELAELSVGDRILFRSNSKEQGIINNEFATIKSLGDVDAQGIGRFEAIVHGANGERVVEVETGKIFFRHGYAVTNYAIQGATIEYCLASIDRNSSYESLLVALTCHEIDCEMFGSRATLEAPLYATKDLDIEKVRQQFHAIGYEYVSEKNEKGKEVVKKVDAPLWRLGFALMASKRADLNQVADVSFGKLSPDLEKKIELLRSEVRELKEKLDSATEKEQKSIISSIEQKASSAYDIRSQMNMQGLESHKELEGNRGVIYKYGVSREEVFKAQKQVQLVNKKLASGKVQESLIVGIKENYGLTLKYLNINIRSIISAEQSFKVLKEQEDAKKIEEYVGIKLDMISALEEKQITDNISLMQARHYRDIEFASVLDMGFAEGSDLIRAKLDEMLGKSEDKKQLISAIKENPDMLGTSTGKPIRGFDEKIEHYLREGNTMQMVEARIANKEYALAIKSLDDELKELYKQLPTAHEAEFLTEIGELVPAGSSDEELKEFAKDLKDLFVSDNGFDMIFKQQRVKPLSTVEEAKAVKRLEQQQSKATGNAERKEPSDNLNNVINTVKPTKPSKPQLTFAEVKSGLSQSVITDIFHRYGPMMNNDAKIERKGDQLKLGSLYMSTSGSKAGLWNRFSRDGSKGDIFKFVEMATGCSKHEALEIVASHAGVVPSLNNNGANKVGTGNSGNSNKIEEKATRYEKYKLNNTNKLEGKSNVWAAHLTVPSSAAKFKPENDLSFIIKQGNEITSTYEYRNINNELLGYTLRIREKSSGSKQVLPVAYCHNEAQGKSRWQLKGITDNGTKPIYKLEQIAANPEKPILIVEGEKTADAASKLLPDYNVVSWIGGAQAVNKVDWSKLKDKVVSIWPDNDQAGIGAASKIANHIDCQNGYSGLVSIVDTEKLSLPEKWDLADEIPSTSNLSNIGINGAIEEARVNNKNVGDLLEVSQDTINRKECDKSLGSIEMLTESNKMHKDEYTSKTIYSNNIDAIATARGIDLGNTNDHKEFIKAINDASYEYQSLQREYERRQSQGTESDQAKTAKGQLCSDIVRDISILHQVQLGARELTNAHREHIEQAVNSQLKDISDTRLNDSDKEMIANNIYKVVNSKEWRSELDAKQEQLAHSIRVKYTAKTIDEFLSSNNDKAISDLANIRSIDIDESGIFAAFKEEHNKGVQGLKELSDKVTIATGFAADNKAVIDEAKKFGYSEDISETVRSLVGMDKQEATRTCLEIRDRHFAEYLDSNINRTLKSFEIDKSLAKTSTEVMSIIAKEQNYLSEKHDNIKSPEYHRKEIYQTTLDAKTNMEKNIVDGLGKALEANQKQGIKGDKELMNILNTAVSSNISKVTKKLEDIADYEQKTYLRRHEIELKCLEKLNYLLDKDKLVSEVKSMDSEEKAKYINNILAKETKKYIEPLLAPHAEEKAKAKNLTEMMSALEKEHRTHCELFKKHEMAIYALDKSNGNMKLSVAISGANDISSFGGIKGVQKVIDHSIDHNIRTEAQIFNDLKNKDLNIKMFSKELERECLRYHRSQVEGHLKDLSKNKVVTIENRRFNDKREYLNYLKDNRNHNYMPNDLINKQMQHIHNHDLKRSEQSEKHQDLQKELHLNKNIGGPSL